MPDLSDQMDQMHYDVCHKILEASWLCRLSRLRLILGTNTTYSDTCLYMACKYSWANADTMLTK